MAPSNPTRVFLGFAVALFALTSAGCFYVPLARSPVDKQSVDPPTLIGDGESKKPIQPSLATKQQVVRLIGEPDRVSADGKVLGYFRQYTGGAWVAPLFLYAWRQRVDEAYRLEFDAQDILIRHRSVEAVASDGLLSPGYGPARDVVAFLDQIGPPAPPPAGPFPQPMPPPMPPVPPYPPAVSSPYRNSVPDGQWYETR
ncbi:hypothetical protein [Humisphaera borealis]|uniref:Outer membrane protein assembly factor BamE n=1 Tax=Humisphaera borealis TaxID=2807512 RepID=A0A7M2WYG1_9BACT|nr:hypothetical protein [Humisphaera borealis]QOV90505.1 hypothetical protein IPV69_03820 [Humisphaera borealis]